MRTWPRAAATRSSRILKPRPYNLRTTRSRNPRRTTKKPLIGSVRPLQMTLLSALAARLMRTRSAASAPVLPPSMYRLATTMSAASRFAASSSFGTSVSSCCRAASITARYGGELASIPSMHAEARPRLPIRWMQRTRGSRCARSRNRSSLPSKASSTTTMVSQSSPASACSSACSSAGMFARSRNAGTTTESSGTHQPPFATPEEEDRGDDPCSPRHDRDNGADVERERRIFQAQPVLAPVQRNGAQRIVRRHQLVALLAASLQRRGTPTTRPGVGHQQNRWTRHLRIDLHEIGPFADDSRPALGIRGDGHWIRLVLENHLFSGIERRFAHGAQTLVALSMNPVGADEFQAAQ